VDVDGARVRYLTAGEGSPLVLLHGTGDSAADWQGVLPELARRHRVIAPDFPGCGGSDRPRAGYSPAGLADFVGRLLDALEIPGAALVGNSVGGLAALRFALEAPGRVPALVLVAAAGLGREVTPGMRALVVPGFGEWATALALTPPGWAQRLWWRLHTLFAHPRRAPAGWLDEQGRLGRRPDFLANTLEILRAVIGPAGQRDILLDRLPELAMPTLILWGERDQILPLAHAHAAAGRLRRGRLAVLPDCGHLPHVECPERFLEALGSWLDQTGAGMGSGEVPAGPP
jgi:4,5:9,10-diseco-3-hydroxy-5,9,17-trioxoandrosta-1(10),2-diene-4-oate hydrolase